MKAKERDMPAYNYDVLVVGAGQGGLPAAHMAANLGARSTSSRGKLVS